MEKSEFEKLIAENHEKVFLSALRGTRSWDDAKDIAQFVIEKALRHWKSFRSDGSLMAWMLGILRNTLTTWRNDETRAPDPMDPLIIEKLENIEELKVYPEEEEDDGLKALVDSLPPIYRKVIYLRFWGDLSYRDIALELDIEEGTVMSRLNRAKKLLRTKLSS